MEIFTLTSILSQNTYKINHQFNWSENCLVYLLTCHKCLKQYVWQNVEQICRRWNNYKSRDRNFHRIESCLQGAFFWSFSRARQERFLNDFSITFKTSPSVPLRREHYERQTMAPYGVNVEDSVCLVFLFLLFYILYQYFYAVMS